MTASFKVPKKEIENRIATVQNGMIDVGIGGLMVVQRVDLFYFSGTAQNGLLYIPAKGEPTLFIKKYLPRAQRETAIKNVIGIKSVTEIPRWIERNYGGLEKVTALELDVMPVKQYQFYRKIFPMEKAVDGSFLIHNCRKIKSEWEIRQMERTAEVSSRTFAYIQSALRPGLTELEFAGMYETRARQLGNEAGIRVRDYMSDICNWHVLSGSSGGVVGLIDAPATGSGTSPAFPCSASFKQIEKGEPVMVDLGTVINGYHTDETRMFSIGDMPKEAQAACQAVIGIHNALCDFIRPGMCVSDVFDRSVELAEEMGYGNEYLGPPDAKVRFVGHGVGLEVVEPPIIAKGKKDIMEPGLTFALEPKMVFVNKFSAGIESVFTVTESGARLISRAPAKVSIC